MMILKRVFSCVLVLSMLLMLVACQEIPDEKESSFGEQEKTQASITTEGDSQESAVVERVSLIAPYSPLLILVNDTL